MSEDSLDGKESISKRIRRDWAPLVIGLIITIQFFGTLSYLIQHNMPDDNREPVLLMLETVKTVWIMAMGYFFGTTASSARKDDIIAKAGPVDPHS